MYDAEVEAKCWEVNTKLTDTSLSQNLILCTVAGHRGACEQGTGQGHWNL